MKKAVFPGSFDPITNGHLDVIERALGVFSNLLVAVATDTNKSCLFDASERVQLIRTACEDFGERVEVVGFSGLLVDYLRMHDLNVIVRGLRAVADYEFEVQMAQMNRNLAPEIETLFLPAGERSSFVSSSIIKQVARLGGDVSTMVPPAVAGVLRKKFTSSPISKK